MHQPIDAPTDPTTAKFEAAAAALTRLLQAPEANARTTEDVVAVCRALNVALDSLPGRFMLGPVVKDGTLTGWDVAWIPNAVKLLAAMREIQHHLGESGTAEKLSCVAYPADPVAKMGFA